MKIIKGGRATGKTYRLVKDAYEDGGVLLASTIWSKRYMQQVARDLGIKCPEIYLPIDIEKQAYMTLPFGSRKAYIDEGGNFLWELFKGKLQIMEVVIESENEVIDMGEKSKWIE